MRSSTLLMKHALDRFGHVIFRKLFAGQVRESAPFAEEFDHRRVVERRENGEPGADHGAAVREIDVTNVAEPSILAGSKLLPVRRNCFDPLSLPAEARRPRPLVAALLCRQCRSLAEQLHQGSVLARTGDLIREIVIFCGCIRDRG